MLRVDDRKRQGESVVVNRASFSPDRRRIVSGSDDKTIKVWDAGEGAVVSKVATAR